MAPESDNVKVVRNAFAAINSGDFGAMQEWATDDFVAYTRMSAVSGKPYLGHDGIRDWVRDVFDQFSEFSIQLEDVAELAPGRVLAAGNALVRGKGSDLPWREDVFYALRFKGGKVRALHMFLSRTEAEEAVLSDE